MIFRRISTALIGILAISYQAAAQNQCNQMPITTSIVNSSTQATSAFDHMLCDSDFKTHEEARNAGISLGVVVYGVPLTLNGTFSEAQKNTWKHEHCETTTTSSTFAQSYQAIMKYVSVDAYKAWNDCQRVNAYGVSCWIGSTSTDDDDKLVLFTKWNAVPGDKGASPKIQGTSLVGAKTISGATLFPNGADLSLNPSVALARDDDSTIVAVINTNRGSCPAYASRPAPIFKTLYVNKDPLTDQAYQETISFDKNDHYSQPPKPRGQGHEITFSHVAPGPISSVQCDVQAGGGGGFTHGEVCAYQGNTARWEGWSNSGDHATIVMKINYLMPTQQCIKHCVPK
jgi:hypothetical protein